MNTDINVIINGKKYSFAKGTSLLEVSKEFQKDFRYPILAAYVDNELCELNYCLKKDAEVIFFDLTSRVGNRIYQKSLIFLFSCSILFFTRWLYDQSLSFDSIKL